MRKALYLGAALLLGAACSATCNRYDAAPLYDLRERGPDFQSRALGPVYERSRFGDHDLLAVRPLYARESEGDRIEHDFLYPLGASRRLGQRHHCWLFPYFHSVEDLSRPEESARCDWLIPLYFTGRSAKGADYHALFPLHGTICDVIGYDAIRFTLFPLYAQFDRASVHSTAWLWPFYCRSEKEDGSLDKWRLFPFYATTTVRDRYTQRSILWPFYHDGSSLDPDKPASWFFILPFYGSSTAGEETRRAWLWPFFSVSHSPRGDAQAAPWPFFYLSESEEKEGPVSKRYFWPFYLERQTPSLLSRYWLWPFVHRQQRQIGEDERSKLLWVLPFYWHYTYSRIQADGSQVDVDQHLQLWPLWQQSRQGEHYTGRFLALWPFRRDLPVQREYEPVWEPFVIREGPGRRRIDLLWGWAQYESQSKDGQALSRWSLFPLWRQDQGVDQPAGWDLLMGLVGRETEADGRRYQRLLWILRWSLADAGDGG